MAIAQRFRICTYGDDFFTGRCANGEQVLMGLLCPHVALYRFDGEGKYLGRELRRWSFPAKQNGTIYAIYDQDFQERLAQQISDWQAEIHFVERVIQVEKSFDKEQCVGIEPSDNSAWAFIFYWSKNYWMNESGEVDST